MPAKFMHNLPKNLTVHLHHNLCAVLPIKIFLHCGLKKFLVRNEIFLKILKFHVKNSPF